MSQNHFAFLGNAVLAAAVLAIAQAGAVSATPLTNPTSQTDKISIVQPSQTQEIADFRSQVKDDDKDDAKDSDHDDDHDHDDHDHERDGDTIKKLPKSISSAIFSDLAKRVGEDASGFRIVKFEQQEWSNGCLGLGSGGDSCTQAVVPGYQVVVVRDRQYWVYRTDESGSLVSYDETVSQMITARSTVLMTRQQQLMTRQVSATSVQATSTESSTVAGTSMSASETTSATTMAGAAMTSAAMGGTTVATSSSMASFSDVSSTYWASSFIAELAKLTIVKGFPDGSFRPDDVVTKAQFAAILRKAFEQAKVRDAIAFRDVSSSYWAYGAIREAYEMGFFGDETKEFNPTLRLTRLDILVALANALNYTTTTGSVETILSTYTDAASIPTQHRSLIAALTERGIIINYPSTSRLELTRVATRSELSAFVYQTLTTIGKVQSISSPYAVEVNQTSSTGSTAEQGKKQNCNQGIGNGSEGCDPGNSRPHGGSNDEGGRTPGNK
ncbi:MAG: S-layer homology domain-containing protein [Myxacorys californica WJT36-NPBG1]|jgi:hypothetical protein|nr:S-layer homology domain-containing protein [Myxacorys californica WJT36-NPBG1]